MISQDYEQRFSGMSRLYGRKGWERLHSARVALIGLGGVGSWTAEALVRSGIQDITLIDLDEVCISNTNRQLHALDGNIGKAKVHAMRERMELINPSAKISTLVDFFTASTASAILDGGYDLIIDAIDSVENKCLLLVESLRRGIPLVTVGGAGGRKDPTQIRCTDLNITTNDVLLRKVRRVLRRTYNFSTDGIIGIPAIFSLEQPVFPNAQGEICTVREKGIDSRMDCETGYGTATFLTGTMGFAAASAGIDLLLRARPDELSGRPLPPQ